MADTDRHPTHCPACQSHRLVGNEVTPFVKVFGLKIPRTVSEGLRGAERFVTCLECGIRLTYLTASALEQYRSGFDSAAAKKATVDEF